MPGLPRVGAERDTPPPHITREDFGSATFAAANACALARLYRARPAFV
ncbi:hypothetical protein [Myceligenerans indicum]|nr:hypothetical protein [Myceligenerans indicum]